MRRRLSGLWRRNRKLVLFLALVVMFRSVVADWNTVPTGSMLPTIVEGDRILVNKMAYDVRIPFTHVSLHRFRDPARGDIVVFDSSTLNKRMVKRIIGVPGDRVALHDNQLYLNGGALSYEPFARHTDYVDLIENLDGAEHPVRLNRHRSSRSSFAQVRIPEGHYLVLGDNRDNSADSRVIGLVPRNQIVGRTRHVVISLDYDNHYLPRSDRFLRDIATVH